MTETSIAVRSVSEIEKDKEVKGMIVGAASMAEVIGRHAITDMASNEEANKMLLEGTKIMKDLESRRKFFVDPYKAVAKAIDGIFNRAYDPLDSGVSILRSRMGEYAMKVDREAKEAEAKILAAEEKGRIKPETAVKKMAEVPKIAPVARTEAGSVSYRIVKHMRIVNADLIPRNFMTPNERLIEATLKAGAPVAGCELYEEKVPTTRAMPGF